MECERDCISASIFNHNGCSNQQGDGSSPNAITLHSQQNAILCEEETDLLSELDKVLDTVRFTENSAPLPTAAVVDVNLSDGEHEAAGDNMAKFYAKFSEKCHEIEK